MRSAGGAVGRGGTLHELQVDRPRLPWRQTESPGARGQRPGQPARLPPCKLRRRTKDGEETKGVIVSGNHRRQASREGAIDQVGQQGVVSYELEGLPAPKF